MKTQEPHTRTRKALVTFGDLGEEVPLALGKVIEQENSSLTPIPPCLINPLYYHHPNAAHENLYKSLYRMGLCENL